MFSEKVLLIANNVFIIKEPLRINRGQEKKSEMMEHIKTNSGKKLFRDFLVSKYCEENLDFIVDVEKLRQKKNDSERKKKSDSLYAKYIAPSASNPLCLSPNWEAIVYVCF